LAALFAAASCLFCTDGVFKAAAVSTRIITRPRYALFVATLKRHGRFVVTAEASGHSGRKLRPIRSGAWHGQLAHFGFSVVPVGFGVVGDWIIG